jgi:multidrug efflux pump subunit AcrA (membrane-fusion protein)
MSSFARQQRPSIPERASARPAPPHPRSFRPASDLSMKGLATALAALMFALMNVGCGDSIAANAPDGDSPALAAPKTRLRVRVEPVRLAELAAGDRVTGTVHAFHRATITAETQGRVQARVVEPGAAVEAGEVIVELEASRFELELRRSQASLAAARTVLRHAQR